MIDIANWLPGVLSKLFDDREVQLELSARLEAIDPRIKWEAGPFGDADTYLAFSPNFYKDLLPVTESLATAMPIIQGWHFIGAMPRKRWTARKVVFKDVEYSHDDWRYRLVRFEGGAFFDIDFFSFDESIEGSMGNWLGVFLASSELGEKLFMRAVDRVNVHARPEDGKPSIAIESLYEQIVDLFQGAPFE